MISNINKEIDKCQKKILSFDIFDTLIIREHFWPTKIFNQVGANTNNQNYFNDRSNAENIIRNKYANLEDIKYEYLEEILSKKSLDKELEVELASCKVNPEIFELYQKACGLGYKIIAISDMYLNKATLKKILENAGYTNLSEIYVSSEYHKTKASGSLFEYVLEKENIKVQDLMHVGDNMQADVVTPSSLGILSFHYQPITYQLKNSKNVGPEVVNALEKSDLSGGLLAYLFWEKWVRLAEDRSYWYRFGYNYSGPILMSFCRYLASEVKAKSLTKLYFMSRDGELMLAGFKKMYPDLKLETEYLYASRRMYYFASITRLDNETLNFLSSGDGTTIKEYFERLCIKSEDARNKFISNFSNPEQVLFGSKDKKILHQAFLSIEDYILSEAEAERKALLNYFNNIGLTSANDSIGVVDIGWAASSQKYLEKILNRKVHGFYLGTHNECYKQSSVNGYLFDKGQPANICETFFTCIELIELLFIGRRASIVSMQLLNNKIVPLFLEISDSERERVSIAEEIHKGALDFINETRCFFEKWDTYPSSLLIDKLITTLVKDPSLEDIVNIGAVPHNSNIGNSSYIPIIDWPLSEHKKSTSDINFLLNLMIMKKQPHIFWLEGFKKYFILTKKKTFITSTIKNFIVYVNTQRKPDRLFRNLFRYVSQSLRQSKRKKVLNIKGTNIDWSICSTGAKIKWFESKNSLYIDFDSDSGNFVFKKSGFFNICGTMYIGSGMLSEVYLYHIKKNFKVKSTFSLIHHDGAKADEAAISFSLVIEARKGESLFFSTPIDSIASQAKVLCTSTHSHISAYFL